MKIVLNKSYGGFEYSNTLELAYLQITQKTECPDEDELRIDPIFIKLIEEAYLNNQDPNTKFSKLYVFEIPDSVKYQIHEYDGYESLYWSDTEIHQI
jgi:hypothetical protein